MNKKIIALILTAILPIINIHAFALTENDTQVSIDYDNMVFRISESVEGARNHKIMLIVTRPSESGELTLISDNDDSESIFQKLYAVSNIELDDEGEFTFEIPVQEGARVGFYGFRIGVTGVRDDGTETDELFVYKGKKFYADENERQNIFEAFSKDDADIGALVNTYGKNSDREVLNCDSDNLVYQSHKEEVIKLFKTLRGEIEFSDFEDIDKALDVAIAITDLNNSQIDSEMLKSYIDILGLETNEFYTEEVADEVADKLNSFKTESKRGFSGAIELKGEFEASFFLAAVNRATREDITDLVNAYEALGVSYGDLNPNEVNKSLTDGNFKSVEDFVTAFKLSIGAVKEALEEQEEKEEVHVRPGGGGGGGIKMSGASKDNVNEVERPLSALTFNDLDSVPWAQEAIIYLSDVGVLNGVGNGAFAPNLTLKREEGAKILICALNMETDGRIANFTDVNIGDWYYPYVAAAYEEDILVGKTDGSFGTGESFTREDFALMLYRVIKDRLTNSDTSTNFTDKELISSYAAEAVGALCNNAIINGVGDGNFAPKEYISRAQAAKMIYGAIKLINGGNAN